MTPETHAATALVEMGRYIEIIVIHQRYRYRIVSATNKIPVVFHISCVFKQFQEYSKYQG